MTNTNLRAFLSSHGIRYWQLAEAAGISPSLLSVWLRHELTGDRLIKISNALDLQKPFQTKQIPMPTSRNRFTWSSFTPH